MYIIISIVDSVSDKSNINKCSLLMFWRWRCLNSIEVFKRKATASSEAAATAAAAVAAATTVAATEPATVAPLNVSEPFNVN